MQNARSAFQRMAAEYEERPAPMPFMWYVWEHLDHGFVFNRPDLFVMARPVISTADPRLIETPDHQFASEDCDAWYIAAMCGNMRRAWEFLPYELPLICFHRAKRMSKGLQFARTERIRALIETRDHVTT